MLIVTYDLNNKSGVDLILPEIRSFKAVRLGPATYALVNQDDIRNVEYKLKAKMLPGDRIWILAAAGPYAAIEAETTPLASVHCSDLRD